MSRLRRPNNKYYSQIANNRTHSNKLKQVDTTIKNLNNGMVVVIIGDTKPGLFCTCCEHPLKTMEDSMSFKKHGVCSWCDNRWTSSPGVEWKDQDKYPPALARSGYVYKTHLDYAVEWKEYLDERLLLSRPKLTLK